MARSALDRGNVPEFMHPRNNSPSADKLRENGKRRATCALLRSVNPDVPPFLEMRDMMRVGEAAAEDAVEVDPLAGEGAMSVAAAAAVTGRLADVREL
jgi:hypothetical protein